LNLFSQDWSEPVNVSNLDGVDYHSKIAIDNNGTIHCVWIHHYYTYFSKLFYSKSDDNGQTWEIPQDVSMNDSIHIIGPNIVTDSQNNIYVSYDWDINPSKTLILFKKFDGTTWSEADTISDNLYASWNNKLVIDHNDRLYCFWYRNMYNGTMYYRTSNDGITWSEINIPYTNGILSPEKIAVDNQNNLHGIGSYHIQMYEFSRYVYFKFDPQNNQWTEIEFISEATGGGGADITCDQNNYPHIVWRQHTPGLGQDNDSTLYRYFTGNEWSEPELIVENDPYSQKISVTNNKVFIIDWEGDENSGDIVFYEKDENNNWLGQIILSAEVINPEDMVGKNNQLNLVLLSNLTDVSYDIYYMNKIVDTSTQIIENEFYFNKISLFPNPFSDYSTIQFEIKKSGDISINVYELNGKLINTLINKYMVAGKHNINWDGSNENGTKVKPGLYFIRVQAAKNIITRSIEIYD
jgi:hypothetical protein